MLLVAGLQRAKMICFFLEQPQTSLMDSHKRFGYQPFKDLLAVRTWMGAFGSPSPKATKVFGHDVKALIPLARSLTPALRSKLAEDTPELYYEFIQDGKLRCTGNKNALKQSQVYPLECSRFLSLSLSLFLAQSVALSVSPSLILHMFLAIPRDS